MFPIIETSVLDILNKQKKLLASSDDLEAMYACLEGKPCISLCCDGRGPDNGSSSDEEREKPLPAIRRYIDHADRSRRNKM